MITKEIEYKACEMMDPAQCCDKFGNAMCDAVASAAPAELATRGSSTEINEETVVAKVTIEVYVTGRELDS